MSETGLTAGPVLYPLNLYLDEGLLVLLAAADDSDSDGGGGHDNGHVI